MQRNASFSQSLQRNLIFVCGKGGVGKTTLSQAIALGLSRQGHKTLWATFEDPTRPQGVREPRGPNLWHLNCEATQAFEEYAALKIRVPGLTQLFLKNKLMRYLSKAAPGIHELVLLGKVWNERQNYDHVVVDMPSTGYGLAMFQATANFSKAFGGGPLHRDAEDMLATFADSTKTTHLIVSLPEEMPLTESLELGEYLTQYFPKNPAVYVVNRKFPAEGITPANESQESREWRSPLAASVEDYAQNRVALENYNLRLWKNIEHPTLDYLPPPPSQDKLVSSILEHIQDQGWFA